MIGRWRAFWTRGGGVPAPVPPGTWSPVPPASVGANVAIRLLQIHLCIIYTSAGLSKLMGQSWWMGEAVWGTIANFEFAPVGSPTYLGFLRWLVASKVLYEVVMNTATVLTLVFEICYPFLIWRPSTRPILLVLAILLHGSIALFMGMKTFALIMLTMNLVFVPAPTLHWALRRLSAGRLGQAAPPTAAPEPPALEKTSIKVERPAKILAGSGAKRKH